MRHLAFSLLALGAAMTALGSHRANATTYGDFEAPSGTIAFHTS